MDRRPPPIDGVAASRVQLPAGPWGTVLDALDARFPAVGRAVWRERMSRGRVLQGAGDALGPDAVHRVGLDVYYYREVEGEARIDAPMHVVYEGGGLVVVDKPHGLAVVPAGRHAADTVLARLLRAGAPAGIAPLHRIDRDTAGLVMLSADPATRARFQRLFAGRGIAKEYEALVRPPARELPSVHRSRLARGTPFHRMCEVAGVPNSETRIAVASRGAEAWHCVLWPVTGRKHQLRVHLAALGAPILHDPLYPLVAADAPPRAAATGVVTGAAAAPALQLLARSLAFDDPLTGQPRCFRSARALDMALLDGAAAGIASAG